MQVREIMTSEVAIASPDDTCQKVAKMMAELDSGVMPVGENDRLVGMVTDRDIAIRAVAKGKSPSKCKVRDIMSTDIKYVYEDESIEDAARNMSQLQVRRLPVLNRDKRLVGIVSLGDVAAQDHGNAGNALKNISESGAPAA
jgi:CBS domain-containing protein